MRGPSRTEYSVLVLCAAAACTACSEKFQTSEGSPEAGVSGAAGTTSDAGAGGAVNMAGAGGREPGTGAKAGGSGGTNTMSTGGVGAMRDGGAGGASGDAGNVDGSADTGPAEPGYRRTVLGDAPLVYWRMGTTSGSSVPDETGGGNDLVLQGTGHKRGVGGAIRGDDDGAIEFDGAASFAIATEPRVLDFVGNAAFTLECWARRSSGGASYFQHLLSNLEGSAGNRDGYILYLLPEPGTGDSPRSAFEYDRPGTDLGIWGPLTAESKWGHYVAVYDGTKATIYVDGTLADSAAVTGHIGPRTGAFAVARSSDNDGFYFKGALDEIAVYPRALGAKDIARHFAFAR